MEAIAVLDPSGEIAPLWPCEVGEGPDCTPLQIHMEPPKKPLGWYSKEGFLTTMGVPSQGRSFAGVHTLQVFFCFLFPLELILCSDSGDFGFVLKQICLGQTGEADKSDVWPLKAGTTVPDRTI